MPDEAPSPIASNAAASLFVILAALLWATMGVFVRALAAYDVGSMEIVALRAVATVAIMLPYLALRRPALLRVRLRDLWPLVGTGICSVLFFNYCYFRTITLTSLSVAAVLLYTAPAMVMILSVLLFREKPTRLKLAALALAFAGCVMVTGTVGAASRLTAAGVMTGLGAGLGYALYSIFGRYALQRGYHPLTITVHTFVLAGLGVTAFVDAPGLAIRVSGSPVLVAWALAMGLVTTVLPYVLYTTGLQRIEASRASIIATVEPVGATLIGAVAYGEGLLPLSALGVGLVVVSVAMLGVQGSSKTSLGPAGP
jgi:drug/metabolite transporter (DMT)-like permease